MLYRLGQVLAKQRRFAEGEAALRRALRGLELGQGPDDDVPANMVRFRVLVDLARALDRDDRGGPPGEAVQASALKDDGGFRLAVRALRLAERMYGPTGEAVVESLLRAAHFATRLALHTEVSGWTWAKYRWRPSRTAAPAVPPVPREGGRSESGSAADTGPQAEAYLLRAFNIACAACGERHPTTGEVLVALAQLSKKTGKYAKAQRYERLYKQVRWRAQWAGDAPPRARGTDSPEPQCPSPERFRRTAAVHGAEVARAYARTPARHGFRSPQIVSPLSSGRSDPDLPKQREVVTVGTVSDYGLALVDRRDLQGRGQRFRPRAVPTLDLSDLPASSSDEEAEDEAGEGQAEWEGETGAEDWAPRPRGRGWVPIASSDDRRGEG